MSATPGAKVDTTCAVPSVEPSSHTITCCAGRDWASTDSSVSPMLASQLYAATMTANVGSTGRAFATGGGGATSGKPPASVADGTPARALIAAPVATEPRSPPRSWRIVQRALGRSTRELPPDAPAHSNRSPARAGARAAVHPARAAAPQPPPLLAEADGG